MSRTRVPHIHIKNLIGGGARHSFRLVQNGNSVTLIASTVGASEHANILSITTDGIVIHSHNDLLGMPHERVGTYEGIVVTLD